jgi:glycosyltransferase involved in cell wall biosynthesis
LKHPNLSIIIPTHNRLDKLGELLRCLRRQHRELTDYEIIVVDDGSTPPVVLAEPHEGPVCSVIRLEGLERSVARNTGAAAARGRILIFLDDDMEVGHDFLAAHGHAHLEWSGALAVGLIRLPDEVAKTPFGRFRRHVDDFIDPLPRGVMPSRNFCAAGNMSIPRDRFLALGGFDPNIVSSEDQELALRHTAQGGAIVFVPEARATHHDTARDIRSYCRRTQWGSENLIPFCHRYPDWPDNVERERVNGFHEWGRYSVRQGLRKVLKAIVASRPVTAGLFCVADGLERAAPSSRLLERVYRLLLGAHIFRGYRNGLKRFGARAISAESDLQAPAVGPIVE